MEKILKDHISLVSEVGNNVELIERIGTILIQSLKRGGKIIVAGNGGSAADAQHFAAELTGRFETERVPLKAIALTTDTSAITAIANDYGYEKVFARQLEAYANSQDVFIAISTSGNSSNVLEACKVARRKGVTVVSLLGNDGGSILQYSHESYVVKSTMTARIQEIHILIIHLLCRLIDLSYE